MTETTTTTERRFRTLGTSGWHMDGNDMLWIGEPFVGDGLDMMRIQYFRHAETGQSKICFTLGHLGPGDNPKNAKARDRGFKGRKGVWLPFEPSFLGMVTILAEVIDHYDAQSSATKA